MIISKIIKILLLTLVICHDVEPGTIPSVQFLNNEDQQILLTKSKFPKKYSTKEQPQITNENVQQEEQPFHPFFVNGPIEIKHKVDHFSSLSPHMEYSPFFPIVKYSSIPSFIITEADSSLDKTKNFGQWTEAVSSKRKLMKKEENTGVLNDDIERDNTQDLEKILLQFRSFDQKNRDNLYNMESPMGEIGNLGNNRKEESYLTRFFP